MGSYRVVQLLRRNWGRTIPWSRNFSQLAIHSLVSWYTLQLSLTNKPGKWYRQRREKVPLCWRPPVASWKTFDPSQWGASTVEWTLMTNRQVHSMEYACAWVWPSTIIVLDQYRKLKPTLPSRALVTRFVGTLLEVRHWRAVILLGMVNHYGQFNSEPVYLEWTIICQQTNKQTNKQTNRCSMEIRSQ